MPKGSGARSTRSMLGKALDTDIATVATERQQDAEAVQSVEAEPKNTAKQANRKTSKQENKQTSLKENPVPEEMVSLSIKVPKSHRKHWLIQIKQDDSTFTKVIADLLAERYGTP